MDHPVPLPSSRAAAPQVAGLAVPLRGSPVVLAPADAARPGFWRARVVGALERIREGILSVREGEGGELLLGRPSRDGLSGRLTVHHPRFWRRVLLGGAVGAAASYADGDWSSEELTAVLRVLARNPAARVALDGGLARALRTLDRLRGALGRSRGGGGAGPGGRRDRVTRLARLMLDPTLTSSCGLFERPDATLEEASVAKLEAICGKLRLGPGDHLVELGCGFGSLALHAARRHGCRVTAITSSRPEHAVAVERVRAAGLPGRVTVLLGDWREVAGTYDKLAAVELIEALGADAYPAFFRRCAALLRADGLMALQTVTVADGAFERARRELDPVKAHVLPGGCVPSTTALLTAAAGASDLRLQHMEELGPHYVRTLAAWRENLRQQQAAAARLAAPGQRRLWDFCLSFAEAAFAERHLGLAQLVLARPRAT